jgi:hypothetical protein
VRVPAELRNAVLVVAIVGAALASGLRAADDQAFTPPPNIPGQSAWIPLHHQRQETNLCVPTSASIILDYFGDSISPREINELSLGHRYAPDKPFEDFTVTLFRDLDSGLARRGYHWKEKDYVNDGSGLKKGLLDVERSLDAQIPVMIDTTTDAGHTVVVAGYSISDQLLIAVDPNERSPGIRIIGFQELGSIWNSRSVGFGARAAVFPQRRRVQSGNSH